MADGTKIYLATRDEVNTKTAKHLLSLVGDKIYEGDKQLTFAEVRAMLLNTPDFVVLVYNDKAYHPNTTNTSNVVFSSTTVSSGNIRVDRITMASNGTATTTYGEAEKTSSKTDDVAGNSTSTTKYPSTKGVADYVDGNYLPLTGGTLSGGLIGKSARFNGWLSIASGEEQTEASHINQDGDKLRIQPFAQDGTEFSLFLAPKGKQSELIHFWKGEQKYNLFGEHNKDASGIVALDRSAIPTDYANMPIGYTHFVYSGLKTNDPFTNTGAKRVQVIRMLGTIESGVKKEYIQAVCLDGVQMGDAFFGLIVGSTINWFPLGGGGMRVPIAYGQGKLVNSNRTLNINGKGTIWINNPWTATCTVVVDGVTIATNYKVTGPYTGDGSIYESIPFDFISSVQVTYQGDSSTSGTEYAYQLYK